MISFAFCKIGLTGSIGTGKTYVARLIREMGYYVSDADDIVKNLYNTFEFQLELKKSFPELTDILNRQKMMDLILKNPLLIQKLEKLIHPLVKKRQDEDVKLLKEKGEKLIVLEVPLLYETGQDQFCDQVILVTCPQDIQQERVLNRPGMTLEKFNFLSKRQIPQIEKKEKSHFEIDTSQDFKIIKKSLNQIFEQITSNIFKGKH